MLYPLYPALGPAVARTRRIAQRPSATPAERMAHGLAVLAAVRDLQSRELARDTPDAPIRCASGSAALDGDAILRAIRGQHAGALARAKGRERTPEQWAADYAAAMVERRETLQFSARIRHHASVDGRPKRAPRRPTMPPRPTTLPPAATIARTWMTGAVGVSFAFA